MYRVNSGWDTGENTGEKRIVHVNNFCIIIFCLFLKSLGSKQEALSGQEIIPFLEKKFALLIMPQSYQETVQLKKLWSELIPHEMKGIWPLTDNLSVFFCSAANKT